MWFLAKGEEYYNGYQLSKTLHYQQLLSGLLAQKTPTTKAIPMRLEDLKDIINKRALPPSVLALMAALWLSAQRPTNLLLVQRQDIQLVDGDMHVWFGRGMKNRSEVEKLMPPIQIWVKSELTDQVRLHYQTRVTGPLFHEKDVNTLRDYLRLIPVAEHTHKIEFIKWRSHYTPYSIKRGALQHLAAWGNTPAAISCLSFHKSMSTLAIYIGSFLSERTLETRNLTNMLVRQPPIQPQEWAQPPPIQRIQNTQQPVLLHQSPQRQTANDDTELEESPAPRKPPAQTNRQQVRARVKARISQHRVTATKTQSRDEAPISARTRRRLQQ
eukprot:PhF_6_TR8799/c0_g1_i2/m.13975